MPRKKSKSKKATRRRRCPRCGLIWPRFDGPACFDCLHNGELSLPARAPVAS
jgi:hypothetical protein